MTIHFPGYSLAVQWRLEIPVTTREEKDNLVLSFDDFPLPEISSPGFEVVWGPGGPPVKYPGRDIYADLSVGISVFWQTEVIQFFRQWREDAQVNYIDNVRDCSLIGFNDDGTTVSEATLRGVWPVTVAEGSRDRTTGRQRATITLAIRRIDFPED